MIKKILIANSGEIACSVIKTARGFVLLGSLVLASCATPTDGPNLISTANVEKMGANAWSEMILKRGVSRDVAQTVRFKNMADKVIAASKLSGETWEIQLLQGTEGVFSLPGYRLGAGDLPLGKLNDTELASDIAFAVAARELKFSEMKISYAMMRQILGGVKPRNAIGNTHKLDTKDVAYSLPPSRKMQQQASVRADEIISKIDFNLDVSK